MAQPLTDGGEADASVDEFRRVGMTQLVQSGVDAGGDAVPGPVLLSRLVAQRTTRPFFSARKRGPCWSPVERR